MLIAGFGKLAEMVISQGDSHSFHVYNRSAQKVIDAAKLNPDIEYISPGSFAKFDAVFLALPPDAVKEFLYDYGDSFSEETVIFHTATAMPAAEVREIVPRHRIISAKFAGHALQSGRENSGGLFVVEKKAEAMKLQEWLGRSFEVIEGEEEIVQTANKTAVEETVRMLIRLEERLRKEKLPEAVMQAVIKQIPGGVSHAHVNREHGAFAKKILEEWREQNREN
ncbi:hypothetical protein [Alteribacillus sp. HJP-4]|uniref:hypothetical protein n=1 Tax=Alteribacillus sp. HJP-4 TaxID=2775394 RepID=UPI0035CCCBA0